MLPATMADERALWEEAKASSQAATAAIRNLSGGGAEKLAAVIEAQTASAVRVAAARERIAAATRRQPPTGLVRFAAPNPVLPTGEERAYWGFDSPPASPPLPEGVEF